MNVTNFVPEVLKDVVAGVKKAREEGIACLLPDVVVFELGVENVKVIFEVPLEDEGEREAAELFREAAKRSTNYTHKLN